MVIWLVALNDKEIFGQAAVCLVAGYETTSVLLSFFLYTMATEPVIQEKVYEEIRDAFENVSENIASAEKQLNITSFRMKSLMRNYNNFHI